MSRIRIDLPEQFPFSTSIFIRITDLNYGGHVGNDTILSLIHEARVRFLRHLNLEELDAAGVGLIMSDAGIEFKSELFYGEELLVAIAVGNMGRSSFDLFYKLEKKAGDATILVARAKTAMVCYNYRESKVSSMPEQLRLLLSGD